MNLFDVYPIYNITPVKAKGCYVYDEQNTAYLDLYGGHGVISIGHTHETYVKAINEQLSKIAFYSNSILNPLQEALAEKLASTPAGESLLPEAVFGSASRKITARGYLCGAVRALTRSCTASTKLMPACSIKKPMALPVLPQPKQW